ncbi:MAG: DUF4093 domain-containing protein [Oscillospiraceae bacterium]|nr:DUF4093 domain-containing protein [Oscillospiraceae bacterium]
MSIKLKQAVIVEGKYDKIKLSSLIDAVIITTDGFGVFRNKEKLELIRLFAKKHGVIILTDSDSAGFLIRNRLKSRINEGEIYNVYIPDVFGKEKRKTEASKENKIGVEGIDADVLIKALERFNAGDDNSVPLNPQCGTLTSPPAFTAERLYDDGLIGAEHSSQLRRKLQKTLGLPERLTAKALPAVLNALVTEEEYRLTLEQIK